ncbi:hypothetical protein RI103_02395 [Paraburkholderia sp. FT54]|uniref:hypothetical protein n=1 Tax=Paraburkholderia sp. FT54 TaxID=3074437 RepID=UPI0028773E0E|nr:hypothetical protein [Paraburkholderia sp. FT54]WNC90231.1 hypothetical protein RI103_02395 [Paraburkholderia sp. FT54]
MSLNFHANVIADLQIVGLSGERGLGINSLKFSCLLTVANSVQGEPHIYIDSLRATVAVRIPNGTIRYVGTAEFEFPLILRRLPYAGRTTSLLRLDLSESQLLALDEIRGAGGLTFEVKIVGVAHSPQDNHVTQDTIGYAVNVAQWTDLMSQLEFSDAFAVGVELPVNASSYFAPSVNLLRVARRHLAAGEYDSAVSACRQALDSLGASVEPRETVVSSRAANVGRPRDKSKLQRALAIFDSVRHYTNLAHHVDEQGRPEVYSRRDAAMILTTACSLVASAMEW